MIQVKYSMEKCHGDCSCVLLDLHMCAINWWDMQRRNYGWLVRFSVPLNPSKCPLSQLWFTIQATSLFAVLGQMKWGNHAPDTCKRFWNDQYHHRTHLMKYCEESCLLRAFGIKWISNLQQQIPLFNNFNNKPQNKRNKWEQRNNETPSQAEGRLHVADDIWLCGNWVSTHSCSQKQQLLQKNLNWFLFKADANCAVWNYCSFSLTCPLMQDLHAVPSPLAFPLTKGCNVNLHLKFQMDARAQCDTQ